MVPAGVCSLWPAPRGVAQAAFRDGFAEILPERARTADGSEPAGSLDAVGTS